MGSTYAIKVLTPSCRLMPSIMASTHTHTHVRIPCRNAVNNSYSIHVSGSFFCQFSQFHHKSWQHLTRCYKNDLAALFCCATHTHRARERERDICAESLNQINLICRTTHTIASSVRDLHRNRSTLHAGAPPAHPPGGDSSGVCACLSAANKRHRCIDACQLGSALQSAECRVQLLGCLLPAPVGSAAAAAACHNASLPSAAKTARRINCNCQSSAGGRRVAGGALGQGQGQATVGSNTHCQVTLATPPALSCACLCLRAAGSQSS